MAHVGHRARAWWRGGDRTSPVAAIPHGPAVLIPRMGITRGILLHMTTLPSSPLLSCHRSTCHGQPPPSRFRRHPSRGKGSPSSPLPLALSWSSSHRSSTPGRWVHRATFIFCMGHRRPPCFDPLQANRPYNELPLRPLLLTDPRFRSDSLSSTLPMTASLPSSSTPSVGHLSEPLYVKLVPIESLGARLAPRH
jgi:hypothetical protein